MAKEFLPVILSESDQCLEHYSYVSGLPLVSRGNFEEVVFNPNVDGESKLALTSTSELPTLSEAVDLIVFNVTLNRCGKPVRRPFILHKEGEDSWKINTPSLPKTSLTAKGATLTDLIKRV